MIQIDYFYAAGWWVIKHHALVNMGLALGGVCHAIIWFQLYSSHDGDLRLALMRFFGWSAASCITAAIIYHPFYNYYVPPLCLLPIFYAVLRLAVFMVRHYGIPSDKNLHD